MAVGQLGQRSRTPRGTAPRRRQRQLALDQRQLGELLGDRGCDPPRPARALRRARRSGRRSGGPLTRPAASRAHARRRRAPSSARAAARGRVRAAPRWSTTPPGRRRRPAGSSTAIERREHAVVVIADREGEPLAAHRVRSAAVAADRDGREAAPGKAGASRCRSTGPTGTRHRRRTAPGPAGCGRRLRRCSASGSGGRRRPGSARPRRIGPRGDVRVALQGPEHQRHGERRDRLPGATRRRRSNGAHGVAGDQHDDQQRDHEPRERAPRSAPRRAAAGPPGGGAGAAGESGGLMTGAPVRGAPCGPAARRGPATRSGGARRAAAPPAARRARRPARRSGRDRDQPEVAQHVDVRHTSTAKPAIAVAPDAATAAPVRR